MFMWYTQMVNKLEVHTYYLGIQCLTGKFAFARCFSVLLQQLLEQVRKFRRIRKL